MRIALTIAGSDSGGGAGIQADLRTFHQFGVFGTSVITAVTAQNTRGVQAWRGVPVDLVAQQLESVVTDLPPAAVKTGMLGTAEIARAVARGIANRRLPSYVLDPVLTASSGDALVERDTLQVIRQSLLPIATVLTPNLDEAEALLDQPVRTVEEMERAAGALRRLGARAVLLKGGHLASADELVDVYLDDAGVVRYSHRRQETTSTHGTGCTLSAAIVAGLAHGRPLGKAVTDAIGFVQRAIAAAPGLGAAGGHGPLNHFVPPPPRPPTEGLE